MPLPRSLFPGGIPPGLGAGQREFPRQLVEQIEGLVHEVNRVRKLAEDPEDDSSGAPVGFFPRVKAGGGTLPTTAAPYSIDWEQVGTVFDDVGAAAATGWQLPESGSYPGNLELEIPWFRFVNTSGQDMRLVAGTADTIAVDQDTASIAGGTVDLTATNSVILLGLVDDQWRAFSVTGAWEIDA